jgi:D-alanyl-D-alanine carboxypeptidase
LRWRFRQHRDERLVRAKTGTLARSDALSGYVLEPRGGDPVAFSIVVNGLADHRAARRRIDRVVDEIVAWQKG